MYQVSELEGRHPTAHLPGDSEVLVQCLRVKEAVDILPKSVLEFLLQNDVVPVRLLNFDP